MKAASNLRDHYRFGHTSDEALIKKYGSDGEYVLVENLHSQIISLTHMKNLLMAPNPWLKKIVSDSHIVIVFDLFVGFSSSFDPMLNIARLPTV